MDIQSYYNKHKETPSDINEHLPVLHRLAEKVNTIIEMGTRNGESTSAFLAAIEGTSKTLTCYDLYRAPIVDQFTTFNNFKFVQADTLKIDIEKADLLFIDTLHTYYQLYSELVKHSTNINTYIALHDVVSYGEKDEPYYDPNAEVKMSDLTQCTSKTGLIAAVNDFLATNDGQNWYIGDTYKNNNGLMILKRK
jgi:predicted O-methyltransferase YrrM